jgi:hypothetical protein
VNLVKCDVLVLLVVVMFFKLECWSLCDTSVWDKINITECINYYLWYSLPVKIIEKLLSISPRCDRLICDHWFWLQYTLLQPALSVTLSYYLLLPTIVCCMCPLLPPTQIRCNFYILPRRTVRCIIISTIATKNCWLHVTSVTTNTNTLQSTYITSKTSSLH